MLNSGKGSDLARSNRDFNEIDEYLGLVETKQKHEVDDLGSDIHNLVDKASASDNGSQNFQFGTSIN